MSPKYSPPVAAPTARRRADSASREAGRLYEIAERSSSPEMRAEAGEYADKLRRDAVALRRYADAAGGQSPYSEDSEGFSFFDDLAAETFNPAARDRLAQFRRAPVDVTRFAISTSTLGGLIPTTIPPYVAEAVAYGLRSSAPLAAALEILPLPPVGMNVAWAKVTTAATVGVQSAESATIPASADEVVASATDPICTVAASIDFSAQSQDLSGGWWDRVIGYELGKALGTEIEAQIWNGSGSSGQIKGFAVMSGGSSEAVGAQTLAAISTAIAGQYSTVSTTLGVAPDLIAMAPRRYSMLQAATAALGLPMENILPAPVRGNVVISPAAPTNLGAGVNEDWIVLVNRAAVPLVRQDAPTVELHDMGPSIGTNLNRRFIVREYVALGVSRRPEGVGIIKGATTPSL